MPTRFVLICFLLAILMFTSCDNSTKGENNQQRIENGNYQKLAQAKWLLGNWFNRSEMGDATEIWKKENDSTFSAISFVLSKKDTVFQESVTLEQRSKDVYYVVKVKGQNDEESVRFKIISNNSARLIFENQQHHFPSRISYTQVEQDSMYAEISGTANGKEKKEGFPFKRLTH